jgi:hypothetical protein
VVTQLYKPLSQSGLADIITCAQVTGSEGYVGNFQLRLRQERPSEAAELDLLKKAGGKLNQYRDGIGLMPSEPAEQDQDLELSTGAVVIATGLDPIPSAKG